MSLSLIITILLAILTFFVLWYLTKFFLRVFIILLLLIAGFSYMYINNIGPFKNELMDINILKEKYCKNKKEEDICDCVVQIIETKADSTFSNNSDKQFLINKSILDSYQQSMYCLEKRNAKSKYKEFLVDIAGINDWSFPDSLEFKTKETSDKLLENFNQ
ncbi:MAG: O-antigen ligase family protein [Bacteroidia bacterium]|nr:O-antigen ligase family protein [Bacteroidia bacterium]